MYKLLWLWGLFCLLPVAAAGYTGKVVAISDGDTLTLLTAEQRQIKIRLAEIDTPEKRQPYGNRARQALSELTFGQPARVVVETVDRYGRTVGTVFVDGVNINREMVRVGAAWVYRQYLQDESLLGLEREARAAGRGLWGLPAAERVPPWEWRKSRRTRAKASAIMCGPKRYCKQMASCAEAMRYLACGVTTLDGDKDGVPCEALCR